MFCKWSDDVSDYQRRSISQSLFFRLFRVHHCQHQWTTSLWECFHLLHSLLLYSSFSTVCGNLEKIKAVPIMIIPGFLLEESCILVRIFFLSTISAFFFFVTQFSISSDLTKLWKYNSYNDHNPLGAQSALPRLGRLLFYRTKSNWSQVSPGIWTVWKSF